MAEESLHIHQGLLSKRIHLAVRDGTLDAGPYGKGPWYDLDEDGVSLEIDSGMLTTVVAYLAQLEVPVIRPPHDPGLLDAWAAGRAHFDDDRMRRMSRPHPASSTIPSSTRAHRPRPERRRSSSTSPRTATVRRSSPSTPGTTTTSYLVHLFSDLKRHDMGDALASPSAQGTIPPRVFLTRPLWGLAETAPYLHDGRAPTVHDAIVLHGGEATAARDAYLALDEQADAPACASS